MVPATSDAPQVAVPPQTPTAVSSSAASDGVAVLADTSAAVGTTAQPGQAPPADALAAAAAAADQLVATLDAPEDHPSETPVMATQTPATSANPSTSVSGASSLNTPASPISNPVATPTAAFGTNHAKTLLEILQQQGSLTPEQLNEISVEHISTGEQIESIIKAKNLVTEEDLVKAKATLHDIPFVKIAETGTDPQALTRLPEGVARTYRMLPLSYSKEDGSLVVAMEDPLDLAAVDFAQQKSGLNIKVRYATPSELERSIAEHYSQSLSSEVTAALEQTSQVIETKSRQQDLSALSKETIREAPITKIVQTIVAFAMKARASDIHVEPQESRTRVRYRIDGILAEKLILPSSVHDAVVSRIKILSGLKIDEKRVPQDGRFNFESEGQEVDLRVSTLPTIHGEKIVMRLLKKDSTVPALSELGLTGMALRHVQDSIKVPHGIVLVTGPTGSGKTTTLYSILHTINTPKVNIMTLEDPVEYQMIGVNQVQINPQAGLTFASGLRSFLRQDPNIIMVGEIRDGETAELAIQASLTGHLVFSTLHTSSAAGAIPRMIDMGAEPFLLASSMTLIMAQRVVRLINPDYKESYTPEPAVVEDIKRVLGPHFDMWCKQKNITPDKLQLYRPSPTRPQTEPEYKGRIGIFEVMPITEEMGKQILQRKPASDLEQLALKNGMLLMKQDGYIKALEGITSIEEVLRVAEV